MHLVNKTSTITVAVVAALVALAIVAHASAALSLAPWHPAGHTAVEGTPGPGQGGGAGSGADRHAIPRYDAIPGRWSHCVPIELECAPF
jgi:hypothetical protein